FTYKQHANFIKCRQAAAKKKPGHYKVAQEEEFVPWLKNKKKFNELNNIDFHDIVFVEDEICIASEQHDITDINFGQQNNEGLYENCEKRLQRALVFVGEIGGNYYNYAFFQGKQVEEISTYVPHVVRSITHVVQEVIREGAIRVVVSGNFPVGSIPIYLTLIIVRIFVTLNLEEKDEMIQMEMKIEMIQMEMKIEKNLLPVYASRMLRSSNGWYWFDQISYISSGSKIFAAGLFNMKEHAIITIFAHCGVPYGGGDAYSIGAITFMRAYYKQFEFHLPILHVTLHAPRDKVICSDEKNVYPDVWKVLDKISEFSKRVRSGFWAGATGKALKDVVAVGIGGSFLGHLFVHTSLQTANVDPTRAIAGLNPETTLDGLDSASYQTVLDNQGDDIELPEGDSEKALREMSLRIKDLESRISRERKTSTALLSTQAELQVELDSSCSREDDVLKCNREFADQFDRIREAKENREHQYAIARAKKAEARECFGGSRTDVKAPLVQGDVVSLSGQIRELESDISRIEGHVQKGKKNLRECQQKLDTALIR
ncbi:hypothetical protein GIB67_032146, partial [Kingdonia uniflora]